jgi:hypothetical protein
MSQEEQDDRRQNDKLGPIGILICICICICVITAIVGVAAYFLVPKFMGSSKTDKVLTHLVDASERQIKVTVDQTSVLRILADTSTKQVDATADQTNALKALGGTVNDLGTKLMDSKDPDSMVSQMRMACNPGNGVTVPPLSTVQPANPGNTSAPATQTASQTEQAKTLEANATTAAVKKPSSEPLSIADQYVAVVRKTAAEKQRLLSALQNARARNQRGINLVVNAAGDTDKRLAGDIAKVEAATLTAPALKPAPPKPVPASASVPKPATPTLVPAPVPPPKPAPSEQATKKSIIGP